MKISARARVIALSLCTATISARSSIAQTPLSIDAPAMLVDETDPIHADLQRFVQWGLIPAHDVNGVSLSRSDVARILSIVASDARAAQPDRAIAIERVNQALARWSRRTSKTLDLHVDELHLGAMQATTETRAIPENGLGQIDADIPGFASARSFRDEPGVRVSARVVASLSSRGAVWFAPRVRLDQLNQTPDVESAGITASVGGLRLDIAHAPLKWGWGELGGLAFAHTGPSTPFVRIQSARAIKVPVVSRLTGPISGTALVTDLGASQNYPHAKFAAWRAMAYPTDRIELGVDVAVHTGGRGSPPASFLLRVADAIPMIDALRVGSADWAISNKFAGATATVHLSRKYGATMYGEHLFDDIDARRLWRCFTQDGGHILGTRIAAFGPDGRAEARAEYRATGYRFYEHHQFVSGVTRNRQLLGDPLGPHGEAFSFHTGWQTTRQSSIAVDIESSHRDGSTYWIDVTGPRDAGFWFRPLVTRPPERRQQLVMNWTQTNRSGAIAAQLRAGVERVQAFGFDSAQARTGTLVSVDLTWRP